MPLVSRYYVFGWYVTNYANTLWFTGRCRGHRAAVWLYILSVIVLLGANSTPRYIRRVNAALAAISN